MRGRVLVVAGSDSGGGAGIQADIKAITALGAYAATAVTALTAQNTQGVFAIHPVPADFVRQQMLAVLDDIGADCVKLGMLHDAAIVAAVADVLEAKAAGIPVVLDPVMLAKGGAALLAAEAVEILRRRLMPRTTLLTPNLPEAEALTGTTIRDVDGMERAATVLQGQGPAYVLVKGGHLEGDAVVDVLAGPEGIERFADARIATRHTHGTGCTLASAIAAGLAQGMSLRDAVLRARAYLREAIRTAPGLGAGHGPLNHAHPFADV
jgi:hydroxymethylpyrimidine/phosphomethylpyrimidine kinase